MISIRTGRIAAAAAAATFLLAATAPAADAPVPVSKLSASISPNKVAKVKNGVGTPVTLSINSTITHPSGSRYELTKLVYKFPQGAVTNGKLFPSCDANKLAKAHGQLSACPKGSKVGGGKATGTAVDIGVTSSGNVTVFNGPGGKSLTINVNIVTPALINSSFSAPLKKTSGKYGYTLTVNIPSELQTILGGPIIVKQIKTTAGGTRTIKGVKRGFIEAVKCPKGGKAPIHSDLTFTNGTTTSPTSADSFVSCK